MTTNRRGFLGLLGASAAAVPFLGQAVSLKSDPKTGALSIDAPEEVVLDLKIAPQVSGDFLVIPAGALRSLTVDCERDIIKITSLDSVYDLYVQGPEDGYKFTIELKVYGAEAGNLHAQLLSIMNGPHAPLRVARR